MYVCVYVCMYVCMYICCFITVITDSIKFDVMILVLKSSENFILVCISQLRPLPNRRLYSDFIRFLESDSSYKIKSHINIYLIEVYKSD
jgi:hypothetical protein